MLGKRPTKDYIHHPNMQAIHSRPYQKMRSKNSPYPKNKES